MTSSWKNFDQIFLQNFLGLFFLKNSPVFNEILLVFNQILPVFNQILPVFYTKNSRYPGTFFPGNGKFENAGNPGNSRDGNSREPTLTRVIKGLKARQLLRPRTPAVLKRKQIESK